MQFDSLTFVLFFVLLLAAYNSLRAWSAKKWLLLLASYLFYAAWNPPFVLLLIASSSLDWYLAGRMARVEDARRRKLWLFAILGLNLSVLAYFKYSQFLLDNLIALAASLGVVMSRPELDLVLPIGISFYTFHSLSYCIDIYRRRFAPTDHWRDYALYVAFFPQLVAGPIVRWTEMREQIETPRASTWPMLSLGLAMLVLGLFEKIVLADSVFAPVANAVFDAPGQYDGLATGIGVLAFSGQIFCDFAGYSTSALGAALMLGFRLPINFRQPYAALGFSDFWRRWHISLSSWLRDYLYVGLGGNRGSSLATYRNLMLTMLIGGLWHGAAWTFVIWGGLHGLYLVIERLARNRGFAPEQGSRFSALAYGAFTLLAVIYAWIWFRAGSIERAMAVQAQLLQWPLRGPLSAEFALVLAAFAGLLLVQIRARQRDAVDWLQTASPWLLGPLLGLMTALIVLSPGENHAFIYFQF